MNGACGVVERAGREERQHSSCTLHTHPSLSRTPAHALAVGASLTFAVGVERHHAAHAAAGGAPVVVTHTDVRHLMTPVDTGACASGRGGQLGAQACALDTPAQLQHASWLLMGLPPHHPCAGAQTVRPAPQPPSHLQHLPLRALEQRRVRVVVPKCQHHAAAACIAERHVPVRRGGAARGQHGAWGKRRSGAPAPLPLGRQNPSPCPYPRDERLLLLAGEPLWGSRLLLALHPRLLLTRHATPLALHHRAIPLAAVGCAPPGQLAVVRLALHSARLAHADHHAHHVQWGLGRGRVVCVCGGGWFARAAAGRSSHTQGVAPASAEAAGPPPGRRAGCGPAPPSAPAGHCATWGRSRGQQHEARLWVPHTM